MQWEWMTDPGLVGGFLVLSWVLKSSLVIVNHLSKGHVNWRAVCMCVCGRGSCGGVCACASSFAVVWKIARQLIKERK